MNVSPLGIVAWALGVVGLSGITTTLRYSRRLSRQFRFLRLDRSANSVDIVLPTSDRVEGGLGIRYVRSTTSVGNLRGATEIAQVAGRVLRKRPVTVAVSGEIESPLSNDLVLIGLPGKNGASRIVIDHLKWMHPEIGLSLLESETDGCCISLDGFTANYDVECQPGTEIPINDFALIVVWVNPLTPRKRRLLLCAGFTSYSTAAACKYLVTDIIETRYKRLRKASSGRLPPLYLSRKWPCFAMLIETTLVNDQVVNVQERAFAVLPDPGAPPWSRGDQTLPPGATPVNEAPEGLLAARGGDRYKPAHFPPQADTGSPSPVPPAPVADH